MARMMGSRKAQANDKLQSCKEFMRLLCADDCEALVRNTGVKVIRAMLYLYPKTSTQDREYARCQRNEDPSLALVGDVGLKALQLEIAQSGGVEVVVSCLSSKDPDTVLGALRLAVTLLAGGNQAVQDLFHAHLAPASSQAFFSRLRGIFDEAIEAVKESKRKAKQARIAGSAAPAVAAQAAESVHAAMMTAVMKLMRRFCVGQVDVLASACACMPPRVAEQIRLRAIACVCVCAPLLVCAHRLWRYACIVTWAYHAVCASCSTRTCRTCCGCRRSTASHTTSCSCRCNT